MIVLAAPSRPAVRGLSTGLITHSQSNGGRLCSLSLQRSLLSDSYSGKAPNFAFAFDIDGVLLRSSKPLPRARKALSYLQSQRIPFILLTNGGGKHESERVADLSKSLEIPLDTRLFVQSHTPFAELVGKGNDDHPPLRDKCVLVTGGDGDKCREVAEKYGFRNVITPCDIFTACPTIWPFSQNFAPYYESHARPLPKPLYDPEQHSKLETSLKVAAVFIFNDPRDWALDTQIILDLLLSNQGYLGTTSPKNNNPNLPNRGYLQDGQPPLYFSNPDLIWSAAYHLPRLGQGGFKEAFRGVWTAITGGEERGVKLNEKMCGKPHDITYAFAEKMLVVHRENLFGAEARATKLNTVYMVGDNPESDILGANQYQSRFDTTWESILVKSGVYKEGEPAWAPKKIVGDVGDAIQWGLKKSGWAPPDLREWEDGK